MTEAPNSSLDALLETCILALEQGDHEQVAAVLHAHPEHAAALRERLDHLTALGLLTPLDGEARIPEQLGEFRLLRQIGSGGMGVVYLAEQPNLERQVALKLVHPEQLFFAGSRERFRREVLAIARLQHPGIVPILTGGEAEGIPFYAMELVHGASLSEVLDELVGIAPTALDGTALQAALQRAMTKKQDATSIQPTPMFHGTWVNVCARLVLQAAEALDHAHGHGVLHRDVKPSNLLLTHEGQLRVIDFGLASAEGQQRITRSGAALGSKPYMAPEQLRCDMARIGPATDVYQLGVTLYELLTTTLPHGDGSADTHQRILAGVVEAPSRRNPHVHPDTDAICLKAMDVDPGRRYAGVRALADDLQAFLEQRTVRARRPPLWLRGQRWVKHRPLRAASLIVAGMLFVVGPTVFAIQERATNTRIREALTATEEQRGIAETNFDAALEAVDLMLLRTAEARLADMPHTTRLRRELVQDAIAIHGRLARSAGEAGNDRLAEAKARSQLRLGDLHLELGDLPAAEQVLEDAHATLLRLAASAKDRGSMLYNVASCDRKLARVYLRTERATMAEAAFQRALAQLDELCTQPDGQLYRDAALRTRLAYAESLVKHGNAQQASYLFDQIELQLTSQAPESVQGLTATDRALLRSQVANGRGFMAVQDGDLLGAIPHFVEALQRTADLSDDQASDRRVRSQNAGIATRLGLIYHQRRQWSEAQPWLDRSRVDYEALIALEPQVPRWRASLARLLASSANNRQQNGEPAGAIADHDRAIALLLEVAATAPADVGHERGLALAYAERADAHMRQHAVAAGNLDFAEAQRRFESLLERFPDQDTLRANYAALLGNYAYAMSRAGDNKMARAKMARALEVQATVGGAHAERNTIEFLGGAAEFAMLDDEPAVAMQLAEQASERAQAFLAERPDDAMRLSTATQTGIDRGLFLMVLERRPDALAAWRATVDIARKAAASSSYGRQLLRQLEMRLASGHLRGQEIEAAREWFKRAVDDGARRSMYEDNPQLQAMFERIELVDLMPQEAGR